LRLILPPAPAVDADSAGLATTIKMLAQEPNNLRVKVAVKFCSIEARRSVQKRGKFAATCGAQGARNA